MGGTARRARRDDAYRGVEAPAVVIHMRNNGGRIPKRQLQYLSCLLSGTSFPTISVQMIVAVAGQRGAEALF